jgi:hypothetical protein
MRDTAPDTASPLRAPFARAEVAVVALIAALGAWQLLLPPIVGVADQGDYARVMRPLGLAHVGTAYEDTVFHWVQPRYRVVPRDVSEMRPSAGLLLAGVARGLHGVLSPDGLFDLRLLGAVHLAFYLAAIWLLLRAARTLPTPARIVIGIGGALALSDVAYVSYLNSFYAEPASLIFLLALLGLGLGWLRGAAPSRAGAWACAAAAVLLVSTKAQHHVLALPLALLPAALLASRAGRRMQPTLVAVTVSLLVVGTALLATLPDWLRNPGRWNGVFYGLLLDSPSPAADLAALGLEPELARWVGVPGLEVNGRDERAPVMEVGGRLTFRAIAAFYLRHPARLVAVASRCAEHAFEWRGALLGNYTRDSGRPARAHAPSLTGWSDLERRLFPRRVWFLAGFLTLFLGVAGWESCKGLDTPAGRTALLCLTVALTAIVAFVVVVGAGGIEDTAVDLFLFQVLFDACLVAAVAWLAVQFARLLPGPTRSA